MSAVNRPNLNFDNEHREHIPYSEVMRGKLDSAYERFMRPKQMHNTKKTGKKKSNPDAASYVAAFNKWFK